MNGSAAPALLRCTRSSSDLTRGARSFAGPAAGRTYPVRPPTFDHLAEMARETMGLAVSPPGEGRELGTPPGFTRRGRATGASEGFCPIALKGLSRGRLETLLAHLPRTRSGMRCGILAVPRPRSSPGARVAQSVRTDEGECGLRDQLLYGLRGPTRAA